MPPMSTTTTTCGKVWFIGAGPGDPELITVKGQRLIREADLVLYAGSLVPHALVAQAKPDAITVDSSSLTLEETHAVMRDAALAGKTVARVHTGDPGLYGATREQAALLDGEGIPHEIVPGVSAAFAAAAAAGVAFTTPETVQSLAITRLHGRTPVPEGQRIRDYARHGASLAIYLSGTDPEGVAEELRAGGLGEDTPVVLACRVGWPDQRTARATLATLVETSRREGFIRQVVYLVLPGETPGERPPSRLYAKEFSHGFRRGKE